MSTINTNRLNTPNAATVTMKQIEQEAVAFARAHGRAEVSNLYVEGTRRGTTPEQAFAAALESNPEAYSEYRDRHNAGAIVATLQKAGVRVQFA